ncbi:MAG: response regulator [Bacilli bacterium]
MKLLIVDDELIRDVITEYAKNEKFETLEAEDGKEALEIIKNNEIDCCPRYYDAQNGRFNIFKRNEKN